MGSEDLSLKELIVLSLAEEGTACSFIDKAGLGQGVADMAWREKPSPLSSESSLERWPDLFEDNAAISALPACVHAFLGAVCTHSPYLSRLMSQSPQMLEEILLTPPKETLSEVLAGGKEQTLSAPFNDTYLEIVKQDLRLRKKKIALLLGLVDLSRCWSMRDITRILSDFADKVCADAFCAAMKWSAENFPGYASLGDGGAEQNLIIVLAMGKHGARELNYSSDIDITVFYDPEEFDLLIAENTARAEEGGSLSLMGRPKTAREVATKVIQQAVALLAEQTGDGYVFRTDLRLRPNPGSTSPAVSLPSAEEYYEVYGQNWERAAFIKSRPIFGGQAIRQRLDQIVTPFVWRRYLDFSAIQDVQAIKRQIHSVKGGAQLDIVGHDVKLGSGGIREIEFFVQTQQLILGGKNPSLQPRGTLDALDALLNAMVITKSVTDDLRAAYIYLRHLEHRLQIVDDEQTHKLPRKPHDMQRIAALMGYSDTDLFLEDILHVFKTVNHHYANLFDTGEIQHSSGSLVFTGVDHDPQTLENLAEMGFSNPEQVSSIIMSWHAGAVRASRLEKARALLTSLVPIILDTITNYEEPDSVFETFNKFLQLVPARTTSFSLFLNNPETLKKVISIINLSPRLAADLARRRHLVEALLDDAFLLTSKEGVTADESNNLKEIENIAQTDLALEDAMNAVRRHASTAHFQTSTQYLLTSQNADEVGRRYTNIADSCIASFLPIARREATRRYGNMPGELAIIAMGRLGVRALTATSDVDIIFVYDAPFEAVSDGKRSLDSTTYYLRLVRSMVTALTAATEEGALLEVDMQLRPSGGSGPAAVSLTAFDKYYAHNAWTWEKMALTKGRIVAGEGALGEKLMERMQGIICKTHSEETLRKDIISMRRKLLDAKKADSVWDIKNQHGGLTDIDFICQFLVLRSASKAGWSPRDICEVISSLIDADELDAYKGAVLTDAYMVLNALQQTARAIWGRDIKLSVLTREQGVLIAKILTIKDMSLAAERLEAVYASIRPIFCDILGDPYEVRNVL